MTGCSSEVSSNALSYFNSLKNYDDSRRNLFGKISNDLTSLKNANDNLINKLLNYKTKAENLKN